MAINVERLMGQLEDEVRAKRRARLVARGGDSAYQDLKVFASVDSVLRRAIDSDERETLLLADLLGDDDEWSLQLPLAFKTHRPVVGAALLFVKRRVLFPLTRWLYEYSLENFRRQDRVNRVLFACVEELAIENARLRQELDRAR